ncbi:hypothetical protein D3C77_681450 [compost metagenome]
MTVAISDGRADGTSINLINSTDSGTSWRISSGWVHSKQALPNYRLGFGTAATGPAAVKNAGAKLTITANTLKNLDYSNAITVDGNKTIEINYL